MVTLRSTPLLVSSMAAELALGSMVFFGVIEDNFFFSFGMLPSWLTHHLDINGKRWDGRWRQQEFVTYDQH